MPEPRPRRKSGPKPKPTGPIKNRLALKSNDPWWAWFQELAIAIGKPQTVVIERSLADLARSIGFRPPPGRQD